MPDIDPLDAIELTDLGEHRIPDRLEVQPTDVPTSGGRRPPPPGAVLVGAITLFIVAIVGADLPAASPRTSVGPSPTSRASAASSATADPCPPEGLSTPRARLGRKGWWPTGSDDPRFVVDPATTGFTPPATRFFDASAGSFLSIDLSPSRCIAEVRVDISATRADGRGFGFQATLLPGDGAWGFSAPPKGDWTVRASARLRGPTVGDAPWAVYLFRVRIDQADFVEPYPLNPGDGGGGGGFEAAVVPVRPCQPLDETAPVPPGATLELADGSAIPGTLGERRWPGSAGVPPDLATIPLTPVAPTANPFIRVDGDTCALNWEIVAGLPTGIAGAVDPLTYLDSWELEGWDPTIAAQNGFAINWMPIGEVVVRATLRFSPVRSATIYWHLIVQLPELPVGLLAAGSGEPWTMRVGCGVSVDGAYDGEAGLTGPSGAEMCPGDWTTMLDPGSGEAAMTMTRGDPLTVSGAGVGFLAFDVQAVPADDPLSGAIFLAGGTYGTAQLSAVFPPPRPGRWWLHIELRFVTADATVSVPYLILVEVAG